MKHLKMISILKYLISCFNKKELIPHHIERLALHVSAHDLEDEDVTFSIVVEALTFHSNGEAALAIKSAREAIEQLQLKGGMIYE